MNAEAAKAGPGSRVRYRRRRPLVARGAEAAELHHGGLLPGVPAREWGLYISTSRGVTSAGVEEPPLFAEPGLFLVKPDATLYWGNVSTMPFARPHFNDIAGAIDFAVAKNYPARGEA